MNNSDNNKDKLKSDGKRFITLTETIAMAIVPVAAYAIIFVYYAGYFSKFEIPLEFISFNLTQVFIVSGGLILLARALLSIANLASFFFLNNAFSAPIRRRVFSLLPITILSLAYFLIYIEQWQKWLVFLVIAIFSYIAVFVSPLLTTRRIKGTYTQKLEVIDERNRQDYQKYDTLYDRFIKYTGYNIFQALYYFALILIIVYNAGISSAENQKLFRVVNTTPESVILYMTDTRMVCSPFDRMVNEVEPSFIVLEIGADPNIFAKLEQVGPLHLNRAVIYPTKTATSTPLPSATLLPTITNTSSPMITKTP
jgi:hypothetical protein